MASILRGNAKTTPRIRQFFVQADHRLYLFMPDLPIAVANHIDAFYAMIMYFSVFKQLDPKIRGRANIGIHA
ncbi:hypothetical protein [Methyloglobulus sp.]|uniref:hypothetical protein n=1 Tax=Methyloglobulus sp. TaxID=2518622 RepID=UPI0032B71BE5